MTRGETFQIAAEALGSKAVFRSRNVYDLDPDEDGQFDLVFMGYALQMLRDPLRGLEAIRASAAGASSCSTPSVCRSPCSRPRSRG